MATIAVMVCGVTAGALFGERTLGPDAEGVVLRASRVVANLAEWLPEETDSAQLVYDGIDGMLDVLDPHSNFLNPDSFKRMQARQEGSFFGIGILISRRQGQVTVIAPIADTPAARVGLRAGDVIVGVDGHLTEEHTLNEVVDLVRGPEGTAVQLSIMRPGLKDTMEIEITRARIPTNSVRYAFMLRPGVGYVRLSEFTNTSAREVEEAVQRLTAEGMKSLIFDLRNNAGGTLDASVGVADTFLRPGQLVVSTRGRTMDSNTSFSAPGDGQRFEGPLVVVVNGGSASAAEIVAGTVQDHDRGLVLGDVTFGKGLVQTVYTVRDAGLALTTARYYTSSGRCIQRDYESFFDYVNHRGNGKAVADNAAETFKTDAGRIVHGGGGIMPDVVIESRELSEPVARLYGQSAYFRFAIELLKKVPAEEQDTYAERFAVTDAVLARFWSFIDDEEILESADQESLRTDPISVDDVRRALRVEILNSTLGIEAGYRVGIQGDEQMQAALEHLGEAEQLWQEWKTRNGA